LGFATYGENYIDTTFTNDTFRGQFKVDGLMELITNSAYDGDTWKPWSIWGNINRLWGEFKFIDGMITLVPAFSSPENEYWVSDKTGTLIDRMDYVSGWKTKRDAFGDGNTFTYVDHANYLMAGAEIGALGFGVMIPNLFAPNHGAWAGWNAATGQNPVKLNGEGDPVGVDMGSWFADNPSGKFIDNSIRQIILGVSFEQSPFEFAAQFYIENYGIYFGGKFFAGPITVGLSFTGVLDGDGKPYTDGAGNVIAANDADPKFLIIGGNVGYEGSGFGAGLKAFYQRDDQLSGTGAKTDFYLSTVGVEPYFFYDAIPSHLQFRLDAGMFFLTLTDGSDSKKGTVWALQPLLVWNFLGTGASTGYYSVDTGIFIRYRIANADLRDEFGAAALGSVNFLDVVFKWGF
jgi:hypothetical protein